MREITRLLWLSINQFSVFMRIAIEKKYVISLIAEIILLGGNREGDTPDPIPNSEVKTFIADGTAHKSVEE